MYALFGLPRKRAAGVSHRPALHGNLFFCNQESVEEFVAEENDVKQSFQVVTPHCFTYMCTVICMCIYVQDCNNFLAGNMLRSSTRYKALEETAVFGSACRHEFPALFLNLKHREWHVIYRVDVYSPDHVSCI